MDPLNTLRIVPVINVLAGIAISAVCLPLIKGKVAPNKTYGFRIPIAFSSEANWYRVNRFGGRVFYRLGVFAGIVGLLGLPLPAFWLIFYSVLSAILIVGGVVGSAIYVFLRAEVAE